MPKQIHQPTRFESELAAEILADIAATLVKSKIEFTYYRRHHHPTTDGITIAYMDFHDVVRALEDIGSFHDGSRGTNYFESRLVSDPSVLIEFTIDKKRVHLEPAFFDLES